MTSKERIELAVDTGIPFMSLYAIEIQTKQLGRNGLSRKQIRSAVANLHPKLFENLKLKDDGTVSLADARLKWERRRGWAPR
jgi:hypothetical protein